jgi:toxin ParE1/3/4
VVDLVYLPSADEDLLDIYLTIARDHEPTADRFIDQMRSAIRRLSAYPRSAPARPELGEGIRSLVVGSYLVLHRVDFEQVSVVRVIHAARDIGAALDADA